MLRSLNPVFCSRNHSPRSPARIPLSLTSLPYIPGQAPPCPVPHCPWSPTRCPRAQHLTVLGPQLDYVFQLTQASHISFSILPLPPPSNCRRCWRSKNIRPHIQKSLLKWLVRAACLEASALDSGPKNELLLLFLPEKSRIYIKTTYVSLINKSSKRKAISLIKTALDLERHSQCASPAACL